MTNKTTSAIDLVELTEWLLWQEKSATEQGRLKHAARYREAADTITRLQAALKPFAKAADIAEQMGVEIGLQVTPPAVPILLDTLRKARYAYRSSVGGE